MKIFIQKFFYPILFVSAGVVAFLFSELPIVEYFIIITSLGLAMLLERWIPYAKEWQSNHDDLKIDIVHFIINAVLNPVIQLSAVYSVAYLSQYAFLQFQLGFDNLSPVLAVVLAIVIGGFFPYWIHRWSHEQSGLLWKLHAAHHSSERLYWLNGIKFHPINLFWNSFFYLFPLLFLGFAKEVIIVAGILNTVNGIYNHANINFKLGWFNYIFNMNELHRWHHSKHIEEANNNYSGGSLVIWDLVFNTFYLPKKGIKANEVGLFPSSKVDFPMNNYWKQLWYPFIKCCTS